jgi:multiple sugar transport system permease protein
MVDTAQKQGTSERWVPGWKSEPRRRKTMRRQVGVAHLFMTPWLLGFVFVTSIPMLASLYLAFTDYDLLSSPTFIGAENFERLTSDPRFWDSARVTVIYVLVSVPLQLAFALFLALVLDKGRRGLILYRSAFYLP